MSRRPNCDDLVAALARTREELRRSRRENRHLRLENQVLREAAESLIHAPARERFAFIHQRRDRFSAKLLCRVLVTDGANYRAWVRGRQKRRDGEHEEQRLTELIFEVRRIRPTARSAPPASCNGRECL